MGKQKNSNVGQVLRPRRTFSEPLKKRLVGDIVQKRATVYQISREYEVSRTAVYKWLRKYSPLAGKAVKTVVEMESESYRSKELLKRVAELERRLGQKQLHIDYLERLVEVAGQELGQDLKKTFASMLSNGSESIPPSTPTR
mgnify:CR=1 FL=1